jgi:prephenate dehydrogenase
VVYQRLYPQCIVTDIASTKSHVQAEVETIADPARFVGGHPLAGRERSGAGAARADLFQDRPWVLTPVPGTSAAAVTAVTDLARRCGAQPVVMPPQRHDEAVALVSHVPQVAASLVAARLAGADDDAVALAGQGLRDVTRIAASDPALWTEILVTNAPAVRAVLLELAADLESVASALAEAGDDPDDHGHQVVTDALRRGGLGRGRLPGKHGAPPAAYVMVPVVVPDRPGELARILQAAGEAGVNVEDITIEHSPGRPVGLVELAVRPEVADQLAVALRAAGWSVHR